MGLSGKWRRSVGLCVLCLTAGITISAADACSWADRPFAEHWNEANEVVVARIVETWVDPGEPPFPQHVRYEAIERFKGTGGPEGRATTGLFFMCSSAFFFPGRTYLLFIAEDERRIDDIMSLLLDEEPPTRASQLAPFRAFAAGDQIEVAVPHATDSGVFAATWDSACGSQLLRVPSQLTFYPTLRRAYDRAVRVVLARLVGQSFVNDRISVRVDVIETFKGPTGERGPLDAPPFLSDEWLRSCFYLMNGWEYVLFIGPDGEIDGHNSFAVSLSTAMLGEDTIGAGGHLKRLRALAVTLP